MALFVGTEKGFTYRLTLTPAARGPAQILIRNPAAERAQATAPAADTRIAAIAGLVRAVANREPLAGYRVESAPGEETGDAAFAVVEVWRGPSWSALAVKLGPRAPDDPAALAARLGPGIAAVWFAGPGVGPSGGRFAVAVREGVSR